MLLLNVPRKVDKTIVDNVAMSLEKICIHGFIFVSSVYIRYS